MNIPDIDIPERCPAFELRIAKVAWRDGRRPIFHPHSHENIELNFLERGAVNYLHCNRLQAIPEGKMGAFWAGYPHRIISGNEEVILWWITIPLREFLAWKFSKEFVRRLMSGDLLLDGDSAGVPDRALIACWHAEQTRREFRSIILLELQARLKRLEANLASPRSQAVNLPSNALNFLHPAAATMAAFITENFRKPLTLGQIAAAARFNPSYAARVFKKNFGHSIGDFLREVRISHAIHLLQNTPDKVLEVAYECGFQSSSRFYDAFHAVTGRRPGEFRPFCFGKLP